MGVKIAVPIVAVVLILFAVGSIAGNKQDDVPSQKMTLTEAVCKMLREGDDAELAFSVAKNLARDHPLYYPDADLAVRAAVADAAGAGARIVSGSGLAKQAEDAMHEALARARRLARVGKDKEAKQALTAGQQALRNYKREATAEEQELRAEFQQERLNINKSGQTIGMFMGSKTRA